MFGVEAVSPGRPGRNNFEVHHVCRDLGFTHMEGLVNLDKLVGKGRFRFIGFPLKIKGGTGSPIRAVAWLDDQRPLGVNVSSGIATWRGGRRGHPMR